MTMEIKPIRTEQDYEAALARVDELMDAELGTPEGEELDVLVDLIEAYESRHVPMGYPSAVEAIQFRMDQDGLSPRDLIPFIGTRAKVSEVLSGKRAITMPMARALHTHLGIPAEVLLRDSVSAVDDLSLSRVEGEREDPRESQADEWAAEALIPHDAWQTSTAREDPTPMAVMHLAQVLHVHPAIVAGRVRHERQNYRLLSQFVGTGQVRSQFGILP